MTRAWLLRMNPLQDDLVLEGQRTGEVSIGWGDAVGLTQPGLSRAQFRDAVAHGCYPRNADLRAAGAAAGELWRFIREMQVGDLVLVPHGPFIHLARVTGPATHDPRLPEHHAHRRKVEWLTPKGTPRSELPPPLRESLRYPRTCIDITKHLAAIRRAYPQA